MKNDLYVLAKLESIKIRLRAEYKKMQKEIAYNSALATLRHNRLDIACMSAIEASKNIFLDL